MKNVLLSNDVKMPVIGLETWKSSPAEVYAVVRWALKLGYTHFDCADIYINQETIGQAIHDAMTEDGLKREDIFITTTLERKIEAAYDVQTAYENCLKRLNLDYLDLFLVHGLTENEVLTVKIIRERRIWEVMEELYLSKAVRAIGLSNFTLNNLQTLLKTTKINPMVNLVTCHPYLPQKELYEFCQKENIVLAAYDPLGGENREVLQDEAVLQIADVNNFTPAQVVLTWNMQRGIPVIPRAMDTQQLKDNLAAVNLELDDFDMVTLSNLDTANQYKTEDVQISSSSVWL